VAKSKEPDEPDKLPKSKILKGKKKRFSKKRVVIAVVCVLAGIVTVQGILFYIGSRHYPRIPALMAIEPKIADSTLKSQRSYCVSGTSLQRNRLERRYVTRLSPERVQEDFRRLTAEQGWVKDESDVKENETARSEGFRTVQKGVQIELDVVVTKLAEPAPDGTYQYLTVVSAPTWKRTCRSGNTPFVDVPSTP
jgi:hypothetical protein